MTYRFRRVPFGVQSRTNPESPVQQYAEQLFVFDMEFPKDRDFSSHGPDAEQECAFLWVFLGNGLSHNSPDYHQAMARDAWQRWRSRVLPLWINKAAGARPRCWYRFDSPLQRVPDTIEGVFQMPDGMSQAQFLASHGLLTPTERRRLPRSALLPRTELTLESRND